VHCISDFASASDAATWCGLRDVLHSRVSTNSCAGYRVAIETVGDASVWYFYDDDGGLVGATRRDDNFRHVCLAGAQNFRVPDDCASSTNQHCCGFDFSLDFSRDYACPDAGDSGGGRD